MSIVLIFKRRERINDKHIIYWRNYFNKFF